MILSPRDVMRGRGPFGPWIVIYNYGSFIENGIPVWCWFDSSGTRVYEGLATTSANLWPAHELWVSNFTPQWYPTPGYYPCSVTAFTNLANDSNRANDTIRGTFTLVLSEYHTELMSQAAYDPFLDGYIDNSEPWFFDSEISDTAGRGGVVRPHGSALVLTDHANGYAYIAIDAIAAHSREDGDRVVLKFDENHDGLWPSDSSEGTYTAFISGGIDSVVYSWLPGQQCPGCTSVTGLQSGNLQFEIRIPIGTRRSDLTIDPVSDLSGCAISFWRGDSCYGWWPQSLELAQWDDPRYYGEYHWVDMAVAEQPGGVSAASAVPTIVRGVVRLSSDECRMSSAELLDAAGRRVMALRPGPNDVRHLPAGIYFVQSTIGNRQSKMTRVVIQR
jgi:hypothetical protein